MIIHPLASGYLGIHLVSALYVHWRGRMRFRFFRQLTDHSTLLAPLNTLMYVSSKVSPKAFLDPSDFPQLAPLAENWKTIRDECLALAETGAVKAADGHTDAGFNSFFRTGWKRFYLSWYGTAHASARQRCPKTMAILDSIPDVKAAMFALLPPGAKLVRHRDPYAGSLRYHLGLSTPNCDDCYIEVDGERRSWKDGEAIMFDETFIHTACNDTNKDRLILFCDVRRPLNNPVAKIVDLMFRQIAMRAAATENVPGERVGWVNRLFNVGYKARLAGKALRKRSKPAYYTLKFGVLAALAVWFLY